jgi:ATP-dependent RNA helicase RhlE
VLVATNIAARGLDVEHITHVISFDVPDVPDDYVHRVGRTARAEAEGDAWVLVSPAEEGSLARIERQIGQRLPRVTLPDFDYGGRGAEAADRPGRQRGGQGARGPHPSQRGGAAPRPRGSEPAGGGGRPPPPRQPRRRRRR